MVLSSPLCCDGGCWLSLAEKCLQDFAIGNLFTESLKTASLEANCRLVRLLLFCKFSIIVLLLRIVSEAN